jgi:NADPH2:quinone reductase
MPYPRVIPHSDGTGIIDAVGPGGAEDRVGQRVWCYGAQSYRPFGTAADYVVVPDALAVSLPPEAATGEAALAEAAPEQAAPGQGSPAESARAGDLAEQGACLGIAGITGYRAVFADGPVRGLNVLVHGAAGGVGSIATQMARRDGAHVIAVVRDHDQQQRALRLGAHTAFLADSPKLADAIHDDAPDGVHRIAEVDLAAHIDLDAEVIAIGGVICSYFSAADRPEIPYWQLGFADTTLRLLGSDDFPPAVKAGAARELTAALADGSLRSTIAARFPLEDIAHAHELVEQGAYKAAILSYAVWLCRVASSFTFGFSQPSPGPLIWANA